MVQRAVNVLRSEPVRSVLFQLSVSALRCVPLQSAVFTHKMSHCVSASERRLAKQPSSLLVTERRERIDPRSAPCGHETREQPDDAEAHADRGECQRIERRNAEEQAANPASGQH